MNQLPGESEVLSAVVHDLRTPLACIMGYAELLTRDAGDERSRDVARRILSAARQTQGLVGDLEDAGRGGPPELSFEAARVGDVVAEAAFALEVLCRKRGVALEVDLPAPGPLQRLDTGRLGRVVANLVINALKHGGPSLSLIRVVVRSDGARQVVSVIDDGCGVERRRLDRLFDKFYRGDTTASGMGLGLHLAKRIVEAHGGTIAASSDGPGKGAAFVFTLPAAPPSTVSRPALPGWVPVAAASALALVFAAAAGAL